MSNWITHVSLAQTNIEYYINLDKKEAALLTGESSINDYDLGTKKNILLFFNIGTRL